MVEVQEAEVMDMAVERPESWAAEVERDEGPPPSGAPAPRKQITFAKIDKGDVVRSLCSLPEKAEEESAEGGDGMEGAPPPPRRTPRERIAALAEDLAKKVATSETVAMTETRLEWNKGTLLSSLLDLALDFPTKCSTLAFFVGCVNTKGAGASGFVAEFLAELIHRTAQAFARGDPRSAKQGVRFLVCCCRTRVVSVASAQALLERMLSLAKALVREADYREEHCYYAEFLVATVLGALPWCMHRLAGDPEDGLETAILSSAEEYMRIRPAKLNSSALSVFKPGYASADFSPTSAPTGGLFGSVSWMWSVYAKARGPGGSFALATIPWFASEASAFEGAAPHELPELSLPERLDRVAHFANAFPTHCSFLPEVHTQIGTSALDRLVVEEYTGQVLAAFHRHKSFAVQMLSSLPCSCAYEAVLAECVFSHMLQLPLQLLPPMFYNTLISELCRAMQSYPKYMSACVRYAVQRIDEMDVEASVRLAKWQAYHLSAFQLQWPWERWGWTAFVGLPVGSRARMYVEDVLFNLSALAYRDAILKSVPEPLHALVSAPQMPQTIYGQPHLPADTKDKYEHVCKMIYQKRDSEAMIAWMRLVEDGALATTIVAAALLTLGAKSFTHIKTLLSRYEEVIHEMFKMVSRDASTHTQAKHWQRFRCEPGHAISHPPTCTPQCLWCRRRRPAMCVCFAHSNARLPPSCLNACSPPSHTRTRTPIERSCLFKHRAAMPSNVRI